MQLCIVLDLQSNSRSQLSEKVSLAQSYGWPIYFLLKPRRPLRLKARIPQPQSASNYRVSLDVITKHRRTGMHTHTQEKFLQFHHSCVVIGTTYAI